jgi:hypothetical protein
MKRNLLTYAVLVVALALCAAPGPGKDKSTGENDDNAQQQHQAQQQQKQQQRQEHEQQRQQQQQKRQEQQQKRQEAQQKRREQQQQQQHADGEKKNSDAGDKADSADDGGDPSANRRAHGDGKGEHNSDGNDNKSADKPADKSARQGKNEQQREKAADKREQNQARRIHEGIKHGQLTPDEVDKLQVEEKALADAEAKFKSDGKLTRDESKQLQQQLNDASLQIWAQRHDSEGNQRSVVRLGKDVVAKDEFTKRIESGEVSGAEARQLTADFRKMIGMKRRLSSENLSEDDRTKLQAEYDLLLTNYFQLNESKQSNER